MTGNESAAAAQPPEHDVGVDQDPTIPDRLEERSQVYHALVVAERVFAVALFAALFITVLLQVFTRYALGLPLPWTEEVARYLLIWTTFIAAAYVGARRLHIAVDLLVARLRPAAATAVDVIAQLVVIVTCVILTAGATSAAYRLADVTSPATNTPMWLVYGSAVLGFGLIGLHSCAAVYMDFRFKDAGPDAIEGLERVIAF